MAGINLRHACYLEKSKPLSHSLAYSCLIPLGSAAVAAVQPGCGSVEPWEMPFLEGGPHSWPGARIRPFPWLISQQQLLTLRQLPASASCLPSPANSASTAAAHSTGCLLPDTQLVPFISVHCRDFPSLFFPLSPLPSPLCLSFLGCNSYMPSQRSKVAEAASRMGIGQGNSSPQRNETR